MAEGVDTVQRVILIASLATLAIVLVRRWLGPARRCGACSPPCSPAPPAWRC